MKGLHLFSASIEINLRHQREGGSTGLVVIGGDSCFKGRGFESWHHILDGHFFTYISCKICNEVCLKWPKINDKSGRGWPIFIFLKVIKGKN